MSEQPEVFTGQRYDGRKSIYKLAEAIRQDLAAAAAEFPPGVEFYVHAEPGQVVQVEVSGAAAVDAAIAAKISAIGNAYNRIERPAYGEGGAFYELAIVTPEQAQAKRHPAAVTAGRVHYHLVEYRGQLTGPETRAMIGAKSALERIAAEDRPAAPAATP